MVDVEKTLSLKYPSIVYYPSIVRNFVVYLLKKLLHQDEINDFLMHGEAYRGFDFVEAVLEYFNFGYTISNKDKTNIPSSGRIIIIANHPLGALDALALISLIKEIRSDVKVLANDVLMQIEPLSGLIIPIDNLTGATAKESIKKVYDALERDEALIVFPSGEVSRAQPTGIKDTKWKKGFLKFAQKTNSPLLPVFIDAKNSPLFYTLSMINKKISTFLLASEMFKKRSKVISFKIGEMITYKTLQSSGFSDTTLITLLKKHLYKISKGKKGIFATQRAIAHPEERKAIRAELKKSTLLGQTSDGKKIYLYEYEAGSILMKEIGRLREFTFRKVEEGTGGKRDVDAFDKHYKHIVLWDDEELEVVGAYRIGEANFINEYFGMEGFYSHSLFEFAPEFEPYLHNSIELGRSFVQPRYWGTRALDYLWQGIGAYLFKNPHIRYMYGPVSLSDVYPKIAKNLIITFYALYFGSPQSLVLARNSFFMSKLEKEEAQAFFKGDDYKEDFATLKEQLSHMDLSVPTLYKQYTELCEEGGILFLDFNIDKEFANCVDSFILVDITKIKEAKKTRYIKGA
ncbi:MULTISPECIES: lysophospholipid acyltransferase family protein [unclassified Sulfurospirillum]|uniref:lysophospholipid acyltransferase family protein n=1 Tax=unclassified Sulfurospirillum TaxID=2618290 RepID=UPI000501E11F|nr:MULTISPECIES: lysophospholipid acyltransferase family protein [unclassified Sulfurospirillum]KFL33568.1 acyltransferase [Sulfurospirillum sp. SCADC]